MRAVVLMCVLHVGLAQFSWLNYGNPTPSPHPAAGGECVTSRSACGCCAMVQEMNRLRTYFNTSLNKLEMETNQTEQHLNNIMDSRSAFSAALYNGHIMKCFKDTLVVYQHVFINLGNGYNATTGIFTVPSSGVYSLAVTIYSDAGSPDTLLAACAGLLVNDQVVVGSREKNTQDQEDSVTIIVAMVLKAGDEVAVKLFPGCFLCDDKNHYNTFSAFLLYPTD